MPTYDYHCAACGEDFEHFQSIKAEPLDTCPLCGKKGKVKRQIGTGAGIIFKGGGFYETDYKKKSSGGDKNASSAKSSGEGAKSESKKTESKTGGD